MSQDLLTAIDGAVARITFNRPAARNAVNHGMLIAMQQFLQSIEHDRRVRCIVIGGAGDHFMAGGDVIGFKEALEKPGAERRAEFEARVQSAAPLFVQMARMPQPASRGARARRAAIGRRGHGHATAVRADPVVATISWRRLDRATCRGPSVQSQGNRDPG